MPDVDELPVRTRYVRPIYPPSARRLSLSGWVELEFVVGADGSTRDVRVTDSQGGSRFEEAAVLAVRQWGFRPGRVEGRAVPVRGSVKITFRLEE